MSIEIITENELLKNLAKHEELRQKIAAKDKNINDGEVLIYDGKFLKNLQLENRNLTIATLGRCLVQNALLKNCNLSGTIFTKSVFQVTTFFQCKFYNTNMDHGSFIGVDFSHSSFEKCEFFDVDFRYSNFSNCYFTNTSFVECDIRYANFTDTSFNNATLYQTKLYTPFQQQANYLQGLKLKEVSTDIHGKKMIHNDLDSIKHILIEKT